MEKKVFGSIGEQISCKYLINNNYKIIEKNFFFRGGEIDIIAFDIEKNELVFFEVKTRSSIKYGVPAESVTKTKIHHILKGIKFYVYKNRLENLNIRIDVLELYYSQNKFLINHIKQII
ncbi:MAG: YraN family protein [Clostridia bacterium]|nr:YraN family protein [Clostridia bacterium]